MIEDAGQISGLAQLTALIRAVRAKSQRAEAPLVTWAEWECIEDALEQAKVDTSPHLAEIVRKHAANPSGGVRIDRRRSHPRAAG